MIAQRPELAQEWVIDNREWADRCYEDYVEKLHQPTYTLIATMGAGKTNLALYIAFQELKARAVERIVVAVPTEALKKEWGKAAARVGLMLNWAWDGTEMEVTEDYHGMIVTYAQIASRQVILRRLCLEAPTLFIGDEIHHCGDDRSWGKGTAFAFEPAVKRLVMSGTLFRAFGEGIIPFVTYEEQENEKVCRADHTYSYAEALNDGVVRLIHFPTYEGMVEFYNGLDYIKTTFADDLDDEVTAQRLRAILDPDHPFVESMISQGHELLLQMRRDGHPDAGGLIVAMDALHAEKLAGVVRRITRTEPTVITSAEVDCETTERRQRYRNSDALHAAIENFKLSTQHWVIAIKMISEGISINRLRVCVYLSNVTAELTVRQIAGRIMRTIFDGDGVASPEYQPAHLLLPRDPRLIAIAQRFRAEMKHAVDLSTRPGRSGPEGPGSDGRQQRIFYTVDASEAEADEILVDGTSVSQQTLRHARNLKAAHISLREPVERLAYILTLVATADGMTEQPAPFRPPERTRTEEISKKRNEQSHLVGQLISKLRVPHERRQEAFARINSLVNRHIGIPAIKQASLAQLEERASQLQAWVKQAQAGTLGTAALFGEDW